MTNMWKVGVEVRKQGAIGTFTVHDFTVRAEDKATAQEWTVDDAHMAGYETRFVKSTERLPNG